MRQVFSIIDFLEDNDGYKNSHGVSLQAFEEDTLFISSMFPESSGSKVVNVEIDNTFDEFFFVKLFKVKCVADLERITHDKLLRLYQVGIMEVTCLVDEDRLGGELVFKKTAAGILVRDGETNTPHLSDRDLSNFEDFVSYTAKYFLLQSVFWGEQG
jgi:hypothetical protein